MVLRPSWDTGRNLERLDEVLQLLALIIEVILGLTECKSVDGFGFASMLSLGILRLATSKLGVSRLGIIKLGNWRLGKVKLGIFRLGNRRLGNFRLSSKLGVRPAQFVHGE